MAAARTLRAVTTAEKAPPKTITQAASKGSHRELLEAMRDRVATAVEDANCPPRDLASLSRRLMEIAKDIEALDAQEEQEAAQGDPARDERFDAEAL